MLTFLILIAIIWGVSRWSEKARSWKNKLIQQPLNYYILLGLLVVGFFFQLDYSIRFGDIITREYSIFELKSILFSATSITLVLLSFFFKKRAIKLTFISLELLFWLSKLFLFKGGYVTGWGVDPLISLYDTTALALRFFIIRSLLKTNINPIYALICTVIVMYIKIYIFPVSYCFYAEQRKFQLESENAKIFLTKGEWIENKDITAKIRVVFYSENAVIYNLKGRDSLFFNQIDWTKEYISLVSLPKYMSVIEHVGIVFQEKGKDTINVNIWYEGEEYKTQMIRKQE